MALPNWLSRSADWRIARWSARQARSASRWAGLALKRLASRGASRRSDACSARRAAAGSYGAAASARQAWATASKWPPRLPLSTVDTYIGSSAAVVWVSYQFRKWPRWRCKPSSVASVACSRASRSSVPIQPKWRAQAALSRYRPILVGDVRCATMSCGSTCRLSGGRWWSSGPTQRSKKRQVSRAMPASRACSVGVSASLRRAGRGRLSHQVPNGALAHSAHNSVAHSRWGAGSVGRLSGGNAAPCGASAACSSSATSRPAATTGVRQWARSRPGRSVRALACAAAAVVHCSRWRRLTASRQAVRKMASLFISAWASNCCRPHSPTARARPRSASAPR